jgi:hypothetical protein
MVLGMMSLSRVYTLTPFLILGVVTVYLRFAQPSAPGLVPALTGRLIGRWLRAGVVFLIAADVFVRLFAGVG